MVVSAPPLQRNNPTKAEKTCLSWTHFPLQRFAAATISQNKGLIPVFSRRHLSPPRHRERRENHCCCFSLPLGVSAVEANYYWGQRTLYPNSSPCQKPTEGVISLTAQRIGGHCEMQHAG